MTSADFSRQALLRHPWVTSVRPPRVRTRSFPPSIRRIYTSGPCSYWASSYPADSPTLVCLMRFLFVGPAVCLGLPSDSASRRTPLPLAMRLALPPALGTFTLKKRAHAEHTRKSRAGANRAALDETELEEVYGRNFNSSKSRRTYDGNRSDVASGGDFRDPYRCWHRMGGNSFC